MSKKTAIKKNIQEERKKLMEEVLDLYDYDNEGVVKREDVRKILFAMGRPLDGDDLQAFKELVDPDETGEIKKDRFIKAVEATFTLPKDDIEELKEAFSLFDVNKDGKVSAKDFRNILVKFGGEFDDQQVDEIFKLIETDKDGNININDFINAWKFQ